MLSFEFENKCISLQQWCDFARRRAVTAVHSGRILKKKGIHV